MMMTATQTDSEISTISNLMSQTSNLPVKNISILLFLCFALTNAFAQEETFDPLTYTAPKTWKKEVTTSAIQYTNEDEATGTFCMISLLKAVPATSDSKENFDLAENYFNEENWLILVSEFNKIVKVELGCIIKDDEFDWKFGK